MQNYYYFPNLPHAIYFFKTMLNVFILNQNIIEGAKMYLVKKARSVQKLPGFSTCLQLANLSLHHQVALAPATSDGLCCPLISCQS